MTASNRVHFYSPARLGLLGRLWVAASSRWHSYITWYNTRADMRQLGQLDDRLLQDIGISRSEIEWASCHGRNFRKK